VAARRLIIVLVVLFGISIAAAAIAPRRDGPLGGGSTTSSSPETTTEEIPAAGGMTDATIAASAEDPPETRARVGDQVALTVTTKAPLLQAEIATLGLIGIATADAPAQFDLLLRDTGKLVVSNAANDDAVGFITVSAAGSRNPGPPMRGPR